MLSAGSLAILSGVSPALAETPVTYTSEGRALFGFDVPDFWTLRTGGPREIEDTQLGDLRAVSRVMAIRPVTEDVAWMGFVSPDNVSTIEGGVDYLRDVHKFLAKDATASDTETRRVGGRAARIIRGTGVRDGTGVNFTAAVIDLPGDRVAVVIAVLRDNANPAYADVLNDVFASFRPVQ